VKFVVINGNGTHSLLKATAKEKSATNLNSLSQSSPWRDSQEELLRRRSV